ncbi:MAG TPA: UDP-N-acetylmuramoyl-tripeptide--D-alanyl-D-alanine ligase [Oscillospiraceae bacterium]|nr:UDP-N-acetylmuramoyl-tripeptide--D-alanyl-D-alanine ligase [Oscillospiraceae bacterium]HPS35324.1 UDP-N-acetylmuramoyl-tripeptide--D-alanyl-D-alanine ligase [Oscillospiraceae bacterium]
MNLAAKIVYVSACLAMGATCAFNVRFHLHMLQLSSYRPERYLDWLKRNFKKLIPNLILLVAADLVTILIELRPDKNLSFALAAFLLAIFFGVFLLVFKAPKAKKPLDFTARAKRLFGTALFFPLAAMIGAYFLIPHRGAIVLTGSLCAAGPLLLFLSLGLNTPIDKMIYNKYFKMAQRKLADSNAVTIGITGSYGKTSTKYILGRLLSEHFNTLITPESKNTPMGVAKVINDDLRATTEVFVAEMGAACVGDIAELCRLTNPVFGVISAIGEQHLKTMGSLENIISTKFELADAVEQAGGTMFLNYDNPYISAHGSKAKTIKYGLEAEGLDFRADGIKADQNGIRFTIHHPGGEFDVHTKLLGRHNVINILAAVAVCAEFGLDPKKTAGAIAKLEPVPHRLEMHKNPFGLTVIDDAYNSNPAGAAAALEALSWFDAMKIAVTPGMVELGAKEDKENYRLGENAAKVCDLLILVGGKRADAIYDGAIAAGLAKDKIIRVETFKEAKEIFNRYASQKAVVLLENDLPDNY